MTDLMVTVKMIRILLVMSIMTRMMMLVISREMLLVSHFWVCNCSRSKGCVGSRRAVIGQPAAVRCAGIADGACTLERRLYLLVCCVGWRFR